MCILRLLLIAAFAAGCAAPGARDYLDDDTASTVTVAETSWVFARERTELAVNARDYVTLTPLQVNRSGQRTLYAYCQLWSTIDRRREKSAVPIAATFAIVADDRRTALPNGPTDLRRIGLGRAPVEPPNRSAQVRAIPIDHELLRHLAMASSVRIAVTVGDATEYYSVWRDGRAATVDFLRHIRAEDR